METMRLNQKLKALCESRNWDRNTLKQVVPEVSESTIYNWFKGKTRPDLSAALQLAREFGVPLDYLADDSLDVPSAPDLSPTEELAVKLIRELGLTEREVIRRLAAPAVSEPSPPKIGIKPGEVVVADLPAPRLPAKPPEKRRQG